MSYDFGKFISDTENMLPSASDSDLSAEQDRRQVEYVFPLAVFHEKLKPLIDAMHTKVDTPRSYIGLALLGAYSSAIGSACVVKNNIGTLPLSMWSCFTGISSSGKSTALRLYKPLEELQIEMDKELEGASGEQRGRRVVMFRDIHVPTLLRNVLPFNPKGLTKSTDELLEWINGLNSYSKKESTDEQFWLSSWNGLRYSGLRAGHEWFVVEKTFCNIFGGIQPTLLKELFKNNRGSSGFVFRILFTNPHESKISFPDIEYSIPDEYHIPHYSAIKKLYLQLPVRSQYDKPYNLVISAGAARLWNAWWLKKAELINKKQDVRDREVASSIFGKMKEYALRFSGILHMMDWALGDGTEFFAGGTIDEPTMQRAILIAEYFYKSAEDTYEYVDTSRVVPVEVALLATLWKKGFSLAKIAEIMHGDATQRYKVSRNLKKWIVEYPKQFNAER